MSATTFIKPIFITTNSHRCVMHILTPLFKHTPNYKNTYAFSSKTVQAILCAVHTTFSQHNISWGLWACLPDQNLQFEFYLRGMVNDQEYSNNPQRKSNKMQQCIKILFHIYMKLNIFRATHRPSSGA